jgi:hypothetical protein
MILRVKALVADDRLSRRAAATHDPREAIN